MKKVKCRLSNGSYTYLYKWEARKQKAILHIVHGSKEHIGRYKQMIQYLNEKGITVYGADLRGHGESSIEQNRFGHIDSYEGVIDDLDNINAYIRKHELHKKITMYGHSMGSFVLRDYLAHYKNYDAIICGTNEQSSIKTWFGKLIVSLTIQIKGKRKMNKLIDKKSYKAFEKKVPKGESWLSNDIRVWDDYMNDPLVTKNLTNETFIAMLSWMKKIRKKESYMGLKGNLLIMAGDDDPVGNKGKGPIKVYKKYKKYNVSADLKLYEGGRHEVHNDTYKKEVYKDIADFVLKNKENIL